MPQVDLETLLCGSDFKVACETMIGGEDPATKRLEEDPDMPAESIQIRIGEDIDWTDINAVYERDDSTKGNTNPKSQHSNQKQQQQQPTSTSQRFSGNLKPKAPIIALPNKIRYSSYLGTSARRLPKGSTLVKKKKAGGDRKSAVPPPEPGSPKVSCFGKVLSERERERERNHHIRPGSSAPSTVVDKDLRKRRSVGYFARLMRMFRCHRSATRKYEDDDEMASTLPEKTVSWSGRPSAATAADGSIEVTPAGLGAFKRFSSGRRSESWGREEETDGQLDQGGTTDRRSVG